MVDGGVHRQLGYFRGVAAPFAHNDAGVQAERDESESGLKVLFIDPGASARSEVRPLRAAVEQEFDLDRVAWTGGPWPDGRSYDAVISFSKFRHLLSAPDLDWRGSSGLRVHYDWDALHDAHWSGSPYAGAWEPTLRRHRFDLLITTGIRSRDHLRSRGVTAEVVHKGFDPAISDFSLERVKTFGTFGHEYPARALMRTELRRAGIEAQFFRVPFSALGATLNEYLAVIMCTFDARLRAPAIGRQFYRYLPRMFVVLGVAPEPMGKLFEVAAAGTAPLVDWTPDLELLGFRDGENAVIYRSLDELIEKALHYREMPEELRTIGRAAGRLAGEKHSWTQRARELRAVLEDHMASRV